MERERRATTVHDRFQVCCECCGFVESGRFRAEMLDRAKHHATKHERDTECPTVLVEDIMAHKGAQSEWIVNK